MSNLSVKVIALAMAGFLALPSAHAFAEDLVVKRRVIQSRNTDLPGGDIASILDTTLGVCRSACVNEAQCTHFTFNERAHSCFLKAEPGAPADFTGATSGRIAKPAYGAQERALERRGELKFISDPQLSAARYLTEQLGFETDNGGMTAEELTAMIAQAESKNNYLEALQYTAAAVNLNDTAASWFEYGWILVNAVQSDSLRNSGYDMHEMRRRALSATINAYLRSEKPSTRHSILMLMAKALEINSQGADMINALQLAQSLQSRADTATLLDDAIGKYGFNVADNTVEADSARPKICVNFNMNLVKSGVDYSTFVQLPEPGMTVIASGTRQLCIGGIEHGKRYAFTLRKGLPAQNGQALSKPVEISAYIKDRSPVAHFAGRGYVLPRTGGAFVPISTVNTDALDLKLYRVTDRNLIQAFEKNYFSGDNSSGSDYDDYGYDYYGGGSSGLSDSIGHEIWSGKATIRGEINREATTRLPMDEALKGQKPGVYVLEASVAGQESWQSSSNMQWFVVSDLGMTTLSGIDGLNVFTLGLGDAKPRKGVAIDLISVDNEVLGTATTDRDGHAKFDPGLTRGKGGAAPGLLVARLDEDLAFLSLTEPEFDLSDRGVEGREAAPPVDVFLTTDRGVYRAGETVNVTALTRDSASIAVEGLPLTMILRRPDGVEYARTVAKDAGAGGHVWSLPISGNAPRGVWTLIATTDEKSGLRSTKTLLVEDFLPDRIEFDLNLPEGPIRLGDTPQAEIDARYLFGAPGAQLAIEGEVSLRAAEGLEGWDGYKFGRDDDIFSARLESVDSTSTDDEGKALIDLNLPELTEEPGRPLEMLASIRVSESSGRPVERRLQRRLTASMPMIGLKADFDGEAAENSDAAFEVVAISPEGDAIPMTVNWTLERLDYDYQWYQRDGRWSWEPVITPSTVTSGKAETGAQPIKISAPVKWGRYRLTVDQADGHGEAVSSVSFWAGWYVPADTSTTPDMLELSLDKPRYRSGDTAVLRVVPRAAGTALVNVVSNHLIASKAIKVKEGENLIELPVTDEWDAGVYVTASVLRPMDVAAGHNPGRALGLTHAAVDPGEKQLTARIEAADASDPRGPMDVAVKVEGGHAGEQAYVTIAAVDQGILNVTGFTPPEPSHYYFGQRKLGVAIRDIYGRLLDGLSGETGEVRSGGDATGAKTQAPPPTEELLAYFSGPIPVAADGYARTTFDLPSFNGSVKLMAVAWSKTGVGEANKDVLVRDPVVVQASLPRFMAPGDTSRLLLDIIHASGPAGQMKLALAGHGISLGATPSGFDLVEKGKATISVPVSATAVGNQTIDLALTTPDGRVLKKTLTIPVQVNDPEISRVTRLVLGQNKTFTFDQNAFAGMMPGTGHATLSIGPVARLNAAGILSALNRYPYGCTEQMTSKALPLIYFNQMAQVLNATGDTEVRDRVQRSINDILTNQASNGAFGLWGAAAGDFWLDAYVTDFLSRAKANGYQVPDTAFRMALDNLRNQVNRAPDFSNEINNGGEGLAYALMVLAREGAAAIGDLRYYADVKADDFATPVAQAQLGAALASYGDQPRADAMFRRAAARIIPLPALEKLQIYRADYGSNFRDAAAVLTLAVESGSLAIDREALVKRITTDRMLSTQEASWALMAAHALSDAQADGDIRIDGAAVKGPLVRALNAVSGQPIEIENQGDETNLTITTYGIPAEPEPAGGNGYKITRSYYTLDGAQSALDDVRVGDRLVTVLEITPLSPSRARLMVRDPLPAGFEIDNPNLISSASLSNLDWLDSETSVAHSEFRQDSFLTSVEGQYDKPFRLAYIVRAVSPGQFRHPAASVEDMYLPDWRAHGTTGTVTINE